MTVFNLFSKKQEGNEKMIPDVTENTIVPNNDSDSQNENEDETKRIITIKWGTGMPIDVIFGFIHKDFEEEGFQDALVNQDIAYRDAKITIIRNDLQMLFRRISLRYKSNIREINVRIENSRKAFAFGATSELEARLATYEEHLSEITVMEDLLAKDDPKMATMIESYKRGFLKGVSAATINFINNNH